MWGPLHKLNESSCAYLDPTSWFKLFIFISPWGTRIGLFELMWLVENHWDKYQSVISFKKKSWKLHTSDLDMGDLKEPTRQVWNRKYHKFWAILFFYKSDYYWCPNANLHFSKLFKRYFVLFANYVLIQLILG